VKERLLRGDGIEPERSRREEFDPIAEGKRYGLAPEVSAAIWEHVRRGATNPHGVCDENLARERFAQLAKRIAERGGQLEAAPFRWTRVDAASSVAQSGNALADPVPGKTTRLLAGVSGRAGIGLHGAPGRTTLSTGQADSDVCTPEDSRRFLLRYVSDGHAARSRLEHAIASRDHHAALMAAIALNQDLKSARHHLANGLAHNEALRAEVAGLEGPAEHLRAKLPHMSAGDHPREFWGPDSTEWRAAIGTTMASQSAATESVTAEHPRDEQTPLPSDHARDLDRDELSGSSDIAHALAAWQAPPPTGSATLPPRNPMRLFDPDPERAANTASLLTPLASTLGLDADALEVRVDEAAARTAAGHGSDGVVVGEVIYLDGAAYDPNVPLGRMMLAHEVAHVAQRRLPSTGLAAAEHEANVFAEAFAGGWSLPGLRAGLPAGATPTWIPSGRTAGSISQTQLSPDGFVIDGAGVRVEQLWYETSYLRNRTAGNTLLLNRLAATTMPWIQTLPDDQRRSATIHIELVATFDEGRDTTWVPIAATLYAHIGLPPGSDFLWEMSRDSGPPAPGKPAALGGTLVVRNHAIEANATATATANRRLLSPGIGRADHRSSRGRDRPRWAATAAPAVHRQRPPRAVADAARDVHPATAQLDGEHVRRPRVVRLRATKRRGRVGRAADGRPARHDR
jgi:hypothetical protein